MAKKKMDLSMNNILTCIAYAIIGILFLTMKSGMIGVMMTIIGVLFVVMGVIDIFKGKDFAKGIGEIVIGVVVLLLGWLITDLVLLIFGILLAIKGAMDLFKNLKNGFGAMLSPLVTLVIGILLIVSKWALTDVICIIVGIVFLVNAVMALFGKRLKK